MNLNEMIKLDVLHPEDIKPKRVIGIVNHHPLGLLCGHASVLWRQSTGEVRYTDVSLSGGNEARFSMNIDHNHWIHTTVSTEADAYVIGCTDSKEEAEKLASDFFKLAQSL